MAEEQTMIQIQRQDPAIEAYRLGLLKDVQEFVKNQVAAGMPPDTAYQVAGLPPAESAAIGAALLPAPIAPAKAKLKALRVVPFGRTLPVI